MFKRQNKRAQTTAEYAIVIALVIGAVVAMQVYVKRGLQGRIKDVVDHQAQGGNVGGSSFSFSTKQYEPYYLTSTSSTSQDSSVTQSLQEGGVVSKEETTASQASREQTAGWDGYGENQ